MLVDTGENLMQNPGTEVNTSSWQLNNSGMTITRDITIFKTGVASLHVEGDGTASQQGVYQTSAVGPSLANLRGRGSAWVYDLLGSPLFVEIIGRNAAGTGLQTVSQQFPGAPNQWLYVTVLCTFNNDPNIVRVSTKVRRLGTGTVDFYIDDLYAGLQVEDGLDTANRAEATHVRMKGHA